MWTDTALRRQSTTVLAGTGCCIRNQVLNVVAARDDRDGPWSYGSQVEDFEMTYRIRELGYHCHVSSTVRAYTDSMDTVRALWGQRMKWQVGTAEDLLRFGVNRLTRLDWQQQVAGMLSALIRIGWVVLTVWGAFLGVLTFTPVWFVLPMLFAAADVKRAMRIPHRASGTSCSPPVSFPKRSSPGCAPAGSARRGARSSPPRSPAVARTIGPCSTPPKEGGEHMYGNTVSAASLTSGGMTGAGLTGATLAATGYNTLAIVLAAVTLMLAGITLIQLVRRPTKVRP